MACDTAFRVVARRCLGDLTAHHDATCRGDAEALHQMRIALTRLRTAISVFSPMVADSASTRLSGELKWLHTHLGAVRDLDVAIERIEAGNKRPPRAISVYRSWKAQRASSHLRLARALRSTRYRRLIEATSGWIENGPWSIERGKQAANQRTSPIAAYSARKLTRWRRKLLKKSLKLRHLGKKKRHRLRLMNKKLYYSVEFLEVFPKKASSTRQAALKYLRKVQKSLGQLNDDAMAQSLATALKRDGVRAPLQFYSRKREGRLIGTADAAYRKLAALQPFRV